MKEINKKNIRYPYPISKNRKIIGTIPTSYNGINFRSKLEADVAKYFDTCNITYEYEKHKIILLKSFSYKDIKVRGISYTPDFIVNGNIIEIKGYPNDTWKLKRKYIMWWLKTTQHEYKDFYEIHNINELKLIINKL